MMTEQGHLDELATQKRLARKYKTLGYDVLENPGPDGLPDFMRGAAPDLVARSVSDNVVVEIKRHASLIGSNDIVGIAERVSRHPDWRFELVVIEDGHERSAWSDADHEKLLDQVRTATNSRLFDMAFVYLVNILVNTARGLAAKSGVSLSGTGDRHVFLDLGFEGILPNGVVEQCLGALSLRNLLAHGAAGKADVSEIEVEKLLTLCEAVRELW